MGHPCRSAEVRQFEWWIQGQTFHMDAKLLEIGAYDLVLGMDWLERFRPMTCDWLEKWIEFQYNDKLIRLQGIRHSSPAKLQEVSMEQLLKWDKSNDLWAAVMVEHSCKSHTLVDSYLLHGIPD
jgi:hypothetical protein